MSYDPKDHLIEFYPNTGGLSIDVEPGHTAYVYLAMSRSGHNAVRHWIQCSIPGATHVTQRVRCWTQNWDLEDVVGGGGGGPLCAFFSMEDFNPEDARLDRIHELTASFENVVYLLLLRDPYNFAASLVRGGAVVDPTLEWRMEVWKRQAREFARITSFLQDVPVNCISYNHWVLEAAYRDALQESLKLPTQSDDALNKVAYNGEGSSFDGRLSFMGRATEMRVTERASAMQDNPIYQSAVSDPELRSLCLSCFGKTWG